MIPISKIKIQYTREKELKVLSYVQLVALCAEMIMIEYQDEMVSLKWKNPAINNHSKRIVESADAIRKHLSSISYNTDKEGFSYGTALQVHRMFKHFMHLTPEQIEEFMNLVDSEMEKGQKSLTLTEP